MADRGCHGSTALHCLLAAAMRTSKPATVCEFNAGALTRPLMAALDWHLDRYTAITFGGDRVVAMPDGVGRVLRGRTHTVRGKDRDTDEALGPCGATILSMDSEEASKRAALAIELPWLLRHASDRSLVALHGRNCSGRLADTYTGPFWIFNISVPCFVDRFHALAAAGSLVDASCSAPPGEVGGQQVLCTGWYRARNSACAQQVPLLERWQAKARDAWPAGSDAACPVRKQPVRISSRSWLWSKATSARSSLSHLYRRHLRYYAALDCETSHAPEGAPSSSRAGSVCLLFKDEVRHLLPNLRLLLRHLLPTEAMPTFQGWGPPRGRSSCCANDCRGGVPRLHRRSTDSPHSYGARLRVRAGSGERGVCRRAQLERRPGLLGRSYARHAQGTPH